MYWPVQERAEEKGEEEANVNLWVISTQLMAATRAMTRKVH
jgi:hypothetical protein